MTFPPTFPDLKVGDRVRQAQSGWTGTVVKRGHPHNGWKVRWDAPRFGATESWIRTVDLELISNA